MLCFALMLGLFFCTGYTGKPAINYASAVQTGWKYTNKKKTVKPAVFYNKPVPALCKDITLNNVTAYKFVLVNYSSLIQIKIAGAFSTFMTISSSRRFAPVKPMAANSEEFPFFL